MRRLLQRWTSVRCRISEEVGIFMDTYKKLHGVMIDAEFILSWQRLRNDDILSPICVGSLLEDQ